MNDHSTPSSITVKRLLLAETGTYNPQYRRPWETNVQGYTLDALANSLDQTRRFTPSLLAGVANQVIAPSATPESAIGIVGGWGERRLRFMMEVEIRQRLSGSMAVVIVLGYTDHPGIIIHTQSIDPRMEFYINSIVQVRHTVENTPFGNQIYTNVAENAHVLVDSSYIDTYTPNKMHRMRPEDVYASMELNHVTGLGDVHDTRTVLSSVPVASRRGNNIAADYAAKLLDTYKTASMENEFGVQQEQDVYEQARGYAQETAVALNPFFSAMQKVRDGQMSNFFVFQDLLRLDPNVEQRTTVATQGNTSAAGPGNGSMHFANAGLSQDWGGSDRLTQVATILSQSVPALMMDLTLTQLVFTTTNRRVLTGAMTGNNPLDPSSRVSTMIANAEGFSSQDLGPYVQNFIVRLEHMILNDISDRNGIDFYIEMRADLIGETWIRISLDGGPMIDYVTPSFADALLVPVITNNHQLSSTLSQDFEQIFHHLTDHHGMPGSPAGDRPKFGVI
ncbi:hypothetical protein [Paraburkholderia sp. BCC1886]|uniref:hypothetical protein n=1 Tax=Paraburkholderia sp. BCC1886 TaxID=2562670 RepID=UPI001182C861|nr:hypothetical protein [Paraburkholderia sp. BCC1886]